MRLFLILHCCVVLLYTGGAISTAVVSWAVGCTNEWTAHRIPARSGGVEWAGWPVYRIADSSSSACCRDASCDATIHRCAFNGPHCDHIAQTHKQPISARLLTHEPHTDAAAVLATVQAQRYPVTPNQH